MSSAVWAADSAIAPPYATLERLPALPLPQAADRRLHRQLAGLKGRPVLVNFWASWCEPCREEIPALLALSAALSPRGLHVLSVAVADSDADVRGALDAARRGAASDFTLPVLADREQTLSRAWGARLLPFSLVLDRRHHIVLRARGAVDWQAAEVRRLLEEFLDRKESTQ